MRLIGKTQRAGRGKRQRRALQRLSVEADAARRLRFRHDVLVAICAHGIGIGGFALQVALDAQRGNPAADFPHGGLIGFGIQARCFQIVAIDQVAIDQRVLAGDFGG